MTTEKAKELLEDRIQRCSDGIKELQSLHDQFTASIVPEVTKIPLNLLLAELEDLLEIKKELE